MFHTGKVSDARAARGYVVATPMLGRAVAGLLSVLILIAILRGLLLVGLAGRSLGG